MKTDSVTWFRPPAQVECPSCERRGVRTSIEEQRFPYGAGPDEVVLTARVPVMTCESCGFVFTDDLAEDARHEAVCVHLGVMTPREVLAVRERYGMSRAEFARITKIGEASLARWENGALIQNGAHDQYLFLLTHRDNLQRLLNRSVAQGEGGAQGQRQRGKGLRLLSVSATVVAEADEFQLRPGKRAECTS
jgi:DNA-binding transcriptional regulator YiaG